MKRKIILLTVVALSIMLMGFKEGKNTSKATNRVNNRNSSYVHLVDTNKYEVTEEQFEDLQFMLEEEKLARDVYITLNNYWNLRVFQNISGSEQQHMDAISILLKKYEQSVEYNNNVGQFVSEEFQNLYEDLVNEGKVSEKAAIQVGIKIEELDIADLKERIVETTPDINALYTNLIKASENHLRAFKRQL